MKKSTVKLLRQIAAELPKKFETHRAKVSGSALIANGIKTMGNGEKINPLGNYIQKGQKEVNHLEKMKNLFKSGGIEAVRAYTNPMMPTVPVIANKIAELKAQAADYAQQLEELKNEQ